MSFLFIEIFNNGIRFVEGASERQSEYPLIPPSHYNNNSDEVWFKVATIAVPIFGAIILLLLIALAIRILKTDSIDSPSKLGGGSPGCSSSSRKIALDFEANLKNSPLLKSHHNQTNPSICMNPESDKKNETQAKLNQIMSIQYSLLPQSCHEHKPNNTDSSDGVCNNNIYRNVNLSLVPSNRSYKDASDKIYEKDVLNSVTANWTGSGSGSYGM